MNRRIIVAAVAGILSIVATPLYAGPTETFAKFAEGSKKTVDHTAWDRLLETYVMPGDDGLNRVNYKQFKKAGHEELKGYVKTLESIQPATLARPEQFAYWANLYNAKTIDVVLDAYPVGSIRDIAIGGGLVGFLKKSVGQGGPWKAKIMTVSGQELSLDNIEHDILRPIFRDPRVHYAVNCASIGCPNLQKAAFTGAKLEKMLNAGAVAYINSPRGFRVGDGGIAASSIYNWFQSDFGGSERGVLKHAAKYAKLKLKQTLTKASGISGYRYDWSLNDVPR